MTEQGKEKRELILEFIRTYQGKYNRSPSFLEIARATGISSKSVVVYHLEKMRDDGIVTWEPKLARTIKIIDSEKTL